jgi:hypothetical protein
MQEPEVHLPSILQRLSTDEYNPLPYTQVQRQAVYHTTKVGLGAAARVKLSPADYWSSRMGTAAGLLELNRAFGERWFELPEDAASDRDAANESFGQSDFVIDVQTHFMADRPELRSTAKQQLDVYRSIAPEWWTGLNGINFYGFADYLRCIFLESETTVAILTGPPPDEHGVHFLTNEEMAVTRELIDHFAGSGRLLNHTVIHPTDTGAVDAMEDHVSRWHPVAWKVYTMGHLGADGSVHRWEPGSSFMLNDEQFGIPFLERAREVGVTTICSHKGLSGLVDNGSPRDIGPSARAFPDMAFVVYHSGYERDGSPEGPYTEATSGEGVNRLIHSALINGIGSGENIYAELGTTWFCLIKSPVEAAHVLGKLLVAFGEDNILWGTDGMFYGPTQPVIDAFRAFSIPETLRQQFGYPELTETIKNKILGLNAAKLYGIDIEATMMSVRQDNLAWVKDAITEYHSEA